MKQFINEGRWDRLIRVLVGVVLLYLWLGGVVMGGWGLALGLFGFVPLLTGLVGVCPLYFLFKFRTN